MKYWKKKSENLIFSIFKKILKIQTTFHQYQKLHSTPPWHGARTFKVLRKYINVFSSYSVKTKREGRTDRRTDGRGALLYLPSRASGVAGDKK